MAMFSSLLLFTKIIIHVPMNILLYGSYDYLCDISPGQEHDKRSA